MDEAGHAPFWDALAGKFFGMSFPEADEFNGIHGTKFIADLMPRSPIYVALLTEEAKAVIGLPHPSGRAALRMLEHEGFRFDRYIDIFDGGPTVTAPTNDIRTVKDSREDRIAEIGEGGTTKVIAATGRLKSFRACCASIKKLPRKGIMIDAEAAKLLEVDVGDTVLTVAK
jgi:arginine N-succinyltransferase